MNVRSRAFCRTLAPAGLVALLAMSTGCGSIDSVDPTAITKLPYTFYGPTLDKAAWGGWEDGTIHWDDGDPDNGDVVSKHISSGGGMFALMEVKIPEDQDPVQLPEDYPPSQGGDFDGLIPNTSVAVHARGSGFLFSGGHWGKNDGVASNDFERFIGGGVTFFAKLGDDPYATEYLQLEYDGPSFQPARMAKRPYDLPEDISVAGPNLPNVEGCSGSGSTKCYDAPILNISLRHTWRQYILPFSAFAQQGYGLHVEDPEKALTSGANIWVMVPKAVRFDVWITGWGLFTAENNPYPEE